jgi:hypothetical protein
MKELIKQAEKKGFDDWMGYVNPEEYVTLCLIQKWLREEFGVHVEVRARRKDSFFSCVCRVNPSKYYGINSITDNFQTYEQALQKGLEEGLKLI